MLTFNPMLRAVLVGAVLCASPAVPAADFSPQNVATIPTLAQAQQVRRWGPFATMRRANEVANQARQQGCDAIAFHNGDGYYVDVRC